MHESECEREHEHVLSHPLGHHCPGMFWGETGSDLIRKLVGVRGFGGFHPHSWVRAWVLLAQELGAGTCTSLLQPSPALGARMHPGGMHKWVWGSSLHKWLGVQASARG